MDYYKSESPSRAGGEAAVQNSTQGSWGGQKEAQGVPKWQKGPKTGRGGKPRGSMPDGLEGSLKVSVGPAPINLEKRPQVDTSFSRPVWPQFCFYPLRGITQRTQSDGRWLRSGFVEVGNR